MKQEKKKNPSATPPEATSPIRRRLLEALPPMLVAVAFVQGAIDSWRKLGDLITDTGRELDLPRRMLEGAGLYTDIRYYWGPLAPYLNTQLYRLFGVSFDTLRYAGIFSAALMCAGLYLLSRHVLGRWASAAIALAFVYLGAFSHLMALPIFNFVLPFNFSATWGIVAAVYSVHLLLVHQRTGARTAFLASTLLLGLCALTKLEVLFAASAAHAAFLLTTGRRLRPIHFGGWLLGTILPIAIYASLYARVGSALWNDNLGALLSPASRHYVNKTMGFLDLGGSLAAIGLSLLAMVGTALAAFVVSRKPSAPAMVVLGAAVFAGYAALNTDVPERALPLLLPLGLAHAAWRWFGERQEPSSVRRAQIVVLWAFCLACVARIPLRAIPSHYGFYLLPPCLICLVLLFAEDLPALIRSPGGKSQPFVVAALALVLGTAASAFRHNHLWYAQHSIELSTVRGTLLVMRNSSEPFLLKTLATFPPHTTMIAVPQGAGLIFASGLTAADAMSSYLPMELQNPGDDERLRERWQANPPYVIVWWRQDLQKVFGVKGFGIDYAIKSGKWVESHYRTITDPTSDRVVLVLNSQARAPPP